MISAMETRGTGTQTYRILAVDDDKFSTELTKIALEGTGRYVVREINDPKAAVAAAREFEPHLIVMDVDMPHLDGRAAALLIQCEQEMKDIPILFVTSMIPESVKASQNPFGWFGPLTKPVSSKRLVRAIDSILQRENMENMEK